MKHTAQSNQTFAPSKNKNVKWNMLFKSFYVASVKRLFGFLSKH